MPVRAIGELNPALLAQCPVMPVPADADVLPLAITQWGEEGPTVSFVHGGVRGGIGGGPNTSDPGGARGRRAGPR